MAERTYQHLYFTNYKDILNWSIQYIGDSGLGFTKKYPMVRIGTFLSKSKDITNVQDEKEYKQITLKIGNGGIVPRNNGALTKGSFIGTKRQTVIHSGQFIMSKIDARNGAFGIVPDELEGAIVTNDFPVFEVDKKIILPQFLVLVSTTDNFIEFARKCSSGTTNRKRIDINAFLQQSIPLPSLKEQNQIVTDYNASYDEANRLTDQKGKLIEEKNTFLRRELHFTNTKKSQHGMIDFVHFKNLSRWDVRFYASINKSESSYPVVRISDLISCFMKNSDGTSLRTDTSKRPEHSFRYIGMESIEKNTGSLLALPSVYGREIKSQTISVPKGYFIYGKLRPYLNKYWENTLDFDNIICSSEFFCFKPLNEVNIGYFKTILSSYIVQEQIADVMSGARMPRIDEFIFKNILVPLPPLEIQSDIASRISQIDARIDSTDKSSNIIRESALTNFKKSIFD